jgi:hypothetical protein
MFSIRKFTEVAPGSVSRMGRPVWQGVILCQTRERKVSKQDQQKKSAHGRIFGVNIHH